MMTKYLPSSESEERMNRKRARHLLLELSRRIYLEQHGTLKGFGNISRHYRDEWRHLDYSVTGGYKNAWNNSPIMKELREHFGM